MVECVTFSRVEIAPFGGPSSRARVPPLPKRELFRGFFGSFSSLPPILILRPSRRSCAVDEGSSAEEVPAF